MQFEISSTDYESKTLMWNGVHTSVPIPLGECVEGATSPNQVFENLKTTAQEAGFLAEHHGANCTVQLGNSNHDRRFYRHQAHWRFTPLVDALKFERLHCQIRHIELRKNFLRRIGIVISRTPDQ